MLRTCEDGCNGCDECVDWDEPAADGRWLENDARPSIPPSATATIYLQDRELTSASFEGATEAEVKAKVEAWAREQFAKVASAMGVAFRA